MRTLSHMMKVNRMLMRKVAELQARNKTLRLQNLQLMQALQSKAFSEV